MSTMLSLKESKIILNFLNIISHLYIFPFHVDLSRGKLKLFEGHKLKAWAGLYTLVIIHFFYGFINMIILVSFKQESIVLRHLPFQFDTTLLPMLMHPVIFTTFLTDGQLVEKVFNELFAPAERKTRKNITQFSIQELLALATPLIFSLVVAIYLVIVSIESDMYHLVINSLALRSVKDNLVVLAAANTIEVYAAAFWVLNCGFYLALTCAAMAKVEYELGESSLLLR